MRLLPLLAAALLASCQAYPGSAPADVTLELRPHVQPAGRHVQALITAYDAAAIQHLALALYTVTGSSPAEVVLPVLTPGGSPLVLDLTRDDVAHTTVADAHVNADGLARNTHYRIVATAYDDGGTMISTVGAGSQTDVTLTTTQAATVVQAAVQVQLIDRNFDGTASAAAGVNIVTGGFTGAASSMGGF